MTIFLYGPDAYRLKQGTQQVMNGYKKKYPGSLNYFSFDLSDKEQGVRFEDALKTVSFFEEAKLVVVKNSFSYSGQTTINGIRGLIKDLKVGEDKKTVLVLVENKSESDLRKTDKELFALLSDKNNLVRNFEYLDGAKLVSWTRSEFASRNCSIDTPSIKALIELTGNESWKIANEIEKLANYRQKGTVTLKDIANLISGRSDLNIFDFVDAIVSKNRPKAYEFLYKELKSGRDPHYILTMIVFGFRNMLMVKNLLDRKIDPNLIAKKSGLHPFVVRKTSASASKFNLDELKTSFGKLLEMDTLSKNGTVNITDALYGFVVS